MVSSIDPSLTLEVGIIMSGSISMVSFNRYKNGILYLWLFCKKEWQVIIKTGNFVSKNCHFLDIVMNAMFLQLIIQRKHVKKSIF